MRKLSVFLWSVFLGSVTIFTVVMLPTGAAQAGPKYTNINLPVRSLYTAGATVTVSSTSVAVRSENFNGNYLMIQNKGAASVYCEVSGTSSSLPTATTSSVEIVAGGNWEFEVIPVNPAACIAASGNNWVSVTEGSIR